MTEASKTVVDARKEAMDSSLCSLVAVVSRERGLKPGEYIKAATMEALASSLGTPPHILRMMDMSSVEELDLIKAVAEQDGIRVSEYIREAVIRAIAKDLKTFENELLESLSGSEPWAFSC